MLKTCSLAAVLLLLAVDSGWAADEKTDRETLKGLNGFKVVVESLTPEAERDGISRAQLQTDVELRLRQSGLPITETRGAPFLHLIVSAFQKPGVGGYVYHARVEFVQLVTVSRTGERAASSTWSPAGILAVAPFKTAPQTVRDTVQGLVDQFIDAYRTVNPKP